jgi:hypothetical protein
LNETMAKKLDRAMIPVEVITGKIFILRATG